MTGMAPLLALALVALALPAFGLLRRAHLQDGKARDLAVYRRQLAELEEELAAGLIEASEAAAARTEIERRILRLGSAAEKRARGRPLPLPLVLAVYLLCLGAGAALYLLEGHPGLGPRPASLHSTALETGAAAADDAGMAQLVEELAARLEREPQRLDGWKLLGRSAMAIGRPALAARAWSRAIALDPDDATLYAALGEALFEVADGHTTPAVRLAFSEALRRDPQNVAARFYAGVAAVEDDKPNEAIATWRKLLAEAPPDAPWRAGVAEQLARLETESARRKARAAAGSDLLAAAADMAPAEREKMIHAMVDRLAARLVAHPEDVAGWLRLARARTVLGDEAGAREALLRARDHASAAERVLIERELARLAPQPPPGEGG
ncbi:MAG: c-type cytochrome biogenesis protein CcmI [Alphaproteobacteria bacterium]|nr:MAG: c-type cytochrome biogenesis protein CcmI [Alphaproteobacteria bacterium]